ncbi:exonuclease domain-containing protein, partial [Helcococcus ovis]
MQFIEFLEEYNKNNKTKLFLDEVSFFKIENELNIKLLSKEDVNIDDIKKYFNKVLENYEVNIEISLFTLKEIFDYFSEVFPSLRYEYNDPKFTIFLLHINQKQFYETKDIFIRFRDKVSKLDIEVEFLENNIDNKDVIEEIAKKREEEILLQIKKAKEKEDRKQEKEVVKKASENGEMFSYGFTKGIPANFTELEDLVNDTNKVKVKGKVYDLESRTVKSGCFIKFSLDNGYYAISCKIFVRSDKIEDFLANFKNGMDVILSGIYAFDEWEKSSILNVTSIEQTILPVRQDLSKEKRIEFNIHTKYTNSESVVDISSLFKTLKTWGHENVGVSDLFNVQAYPEIYKVAKSNGIKLNLGLQTNFIDSEMTILRNYYNLPLDNKDYVVFDLETTGLSNFTDKIIEFGAVKIRNGEIIEVFEEFVNPKEPLSEFTTELTGITNDMVVNADTIDIVLPKFLEFTKNTILVAHNAEFDVEFILAKTSEVGLEFKPVYADTMYISRALNPN